MGRKLDIIVIVLVMSLFACADHAAAGQAQVAGSIVGRVTDESGAVLPGVTVTATSAALQVPQVVDVTGTQGDYRLTPLPIGTYQVEYSLREGVSRAAITAQSARHTSRGDVPRSVHLSARL